MKNHPRRKRIKEYEHITAPLNVKSIHTRKNRIEASTRVFSVVEDRACHVKEAHKFLMIEALIEEWLKQFQNTCDCQEFSACNSYQGFYEDEFAYYEPKEFGPDYGGLYISLEKVRELALIANNETGQKVREAYMTLVDLLHHDISSVTFRKAS